MFNIIISPIFEAMERHILHVRLAVYKQKKKIIKELHITSLVGKKESKI